MFAGLTGDMDITSSYLLSVNIEPKILGTGINKAYIRREYLMLP